MAQRQLAQSLTRTPGALVNFVKESRDELRLRKVSWPSREVTIRYTVIVIVASLVVGSVIGGMDYLLTLLIERII
jgi:preprotein translocase subunit SecE